MKLHIQKVIIFSLLCLRILPSKLSQSLRKAALTSQLMHACMKILLKSASVVKYKSFTAQGQLRVVALEI